jgi:hypothetical protein
VLHVVVYNGDRRWDAPLTLAVRYEVVDLVAARLDAVPRARTC